jgi:hypothetical protein
MDEAMDLLDWQAEDFLGLDVGDVLSVKGDNQWEPHWVTADPGAVAFLVLFKVRYGSRFKVFSRVNSTRRSWINGAGKQCWHWVLNFIQAIGLPDMGVDWDDIHLVKTKWKKGGLAKSNGLKAYVDNSFENLYHIGMQCPNCRLIQYNNNGFNTGAFTVKQRDRDLVNFTEIAEKVIVIRSWYELAMMCKLPVTQQLWDSVVRASPPYHPWSLSLVHMVECQLYDLTQVPRQPPCRPTGIDMDAEPRPSSHALYVIDAEGDEDLADQSRPLPSPPCGRGVFVGGSESIQIPHGSPRALFGSQQWSADPCLQSGQGVVRSLPPVFPPDPPSPAPQAQEAQATLLHALMNSDRGGTITVTPNGTFSVTIDSRERPAVTRGQLAEGNKRQRALDHHRPLQESTAHSVSTPRPNNSLVMCTVCGRDPADQDCSHRCCSTCCNASFEWCSQHSGV